MDPLIVHAPQEIRLSFVYKVILCNEYIYESTSELLIFVHVLKPLSHVCGHAKFKSLCIFFCKDMSVKASEPVVWPC